MVGRRPRTPSASPCGAGRGVSTYAVVYKHTERRVAYVTADSKSCAAQLVRDREEIDSDFEDEIGERRIESVTLMDGGK
jgi:hypothetical protein